MLLPVMLDVVPHADGGWLVDANNHRLAVIVPPGEAALSVMVRDVLRDGVQAVLPRDELILLRKDALNVLKGTMMKQENS